MKRFMLAVLAVICTTACSRLAHAFNGVGHSVISLIAYEKLSNAQRNAIHEVLKQHPHYQEYLIDDLPDNASKRRWSFVRASTWCDWVRTNHTSQYHESPWHYVNYPYTMGQATTTLPAMLPQSKNIQERLPLAITMVENGGATNPLGLPSGLTEAQRRAVAMTWMFHTTGDFHQPLHVTAMVDPVRWPASEHGDQGGNKIAILTGPSTKPKKLHSYWDGILGANTNYDNLQDIANAITTDPPFSPTELAALASNTDLAAWALDGYKLAGQFCYLNGTLVLSPWNDDYEDGAEPAPDVPTLSDAVQNDAKRVYRQRLLIAGERLAHRLKLLFP